MPPPLGCHKPLIEWEHVLCSLEGVLFVQVGSNSGMDVHDPVWHYATRCRWHGIALEPVNSTFQRLQNNYAPFPRVQPVRAALSNRAGAQEMVTGIGWSGEASRFVWNAREQKWRAGRRPKERVSTVTLEDVWAMPPVAGAPRVHILIVDAEGEEGKILAGRPLPSPRPELVLYEHKHLERGVQHRINESLHKQGYRLATSIGHGANPGDLLYARAAGPYAGGACQATGPTGPDRPIRN